MLKLTPTWTVLMLAAVTALGPLAVNVYLPALPAIAQTLDAGPDQVQLTLSLYMASFALAQLICGPLSDRLGRKPVLLGGMVIFAVASLLCAFAPTIETLLAARVLQALGGAVGPVLGSAAVRDLYEPRDAAKVLSYMAGTMALAPALAPVGGALLLGLYGWGATFVFLMAYAAFLVAVIILFLPEPLPLTHRQSVQLRTILGTFCTLLNERRFIGYSLVNAAAFSGMFAFLSGSSFVLIEFLGVSPTQYGMLFATCAAAFLCGTLVAARLSRELGIDRLVALGSSLCALGGVVMASLAWWGIFEVFAVILPHMLFMVGVGILMPQTIAGAIAPFPRSAGTASSIFGFIQMTTAASVGAVVGQLYGGTSRTMATVMAIAGLLALVGYRVLLRPAARPIGMAEDAPGAD